MGDIIPEDVDDFINDFLKGFLKIDVLDYQKIGADEGYIAIYVGDLYEKQEDVLENIGFKRFNEELWILEGSDIDITKLKDVLVDYLSEKEAEEWKELIYMRVDVDDLYRARNDKSLFKQPYTTPKLVIKWYRKISIDESTFNDFVQDLNKLFREALDENFNHYFLKILGAIRNRIGHSKTKPKETKIARQYIGEKIGLEYPRYWYHYITLQISLIEDAIDFLDNIKNELEDDK